MPRRLRLPRGPMVLICVNELLRITRNLFYSEYNYAGNECLLYLATKRRAEFSGHFPMEAQVPYVFSLTTTIPASAQEIYDA